MGKLTTHNNAKESKELSSSGKKQSSTYDVSTTLKNYFSSVEGTIGKTSDGVDTKKRVRLFFI